METHTQRNSLMSVKMAMGKLRREVLVEPSLEALARNQPCRHPDLELPRPWASQTNSDTWLQPLQQMHPLLSLSCSLAPQARGLPDSSVGKESACNAGDTGLTPGLGRSAAEGIGYPLQYPWVSLVAQLVKNPPAMWETWVRSLGWEDHLGKGTATHSSILA